MFDYGKIYIVSILLPNLSMYDSALWHVLRHVLTSNKCIKLFLVYRRRHSLTQVLIVTGLSSSDTVMYNSSCISAISWQNFPNVCSISLGSIMCDRFYFHYVSFIVVVLYVCNVCVFVLIDMGLVA